MTDVMEMRGDAAQLTSGVYALLFTDIEGSTALLQSIGDGYDAVLSRHQSIVRKLAREGNGLEIGTQGDSFFLIFDSVSDAFRTAVALQRAHHAEAWPRGVRVRVRAGLHFGMVRMLERECVGLDVHRAARICAAGHGGQVVLSREAVEGLGPGAAEHCGVVIRDLGRHRLKDIRYPESLFDVMDAGTDSAFAPLRSLGARHSNISAPRGPIVGREEEIEKVVGLLAYHPGRLVTITGAAGTGKTSLAERVASVLLDDFSDGVYFTDLGPVKEPGLVFVTVAHGLGIRDFPARPVEMDIAAFVGAERQLLILDTFEHVLGAARGVGRLLNECPNLRVLVTSRATLGLAGEREFALGPLDLPAAEDPEPETRGAMRLFVDKVREFDPDFSVSEANRKTIAEIVTRLEGVPLALEIAAARLKLLTPDKLLTRLESRFRVLRSDRRDVQRHRTLRDAIEWSDRLLEPEERRALQRLSVFAGGFRIDDAEAVLEATDGNNVDVLAAVASLVSKSLLRRRTVNGEPRFSMYDMVREYAGEALDEAGDAERMRAAHLAHFARLSEECGALAMHRDQRRHVVRLVEEVDNVRAALRHALASDDIDSVARIVQALYWYWISQGQFTEALQWIGRSMELVARTGPSAAGGAILQAAAYVKAAAGDYVGAYPHARDAEAMFAQIEHASGVTQSGLLHAISAAAAGEIEDPTPRLLAAVEQARGSDDRYFTAIGQIIMGEMARMQGMREAAEGFYSEALAMLETIGNTFWTGALTQNIGHFRIADGRIDDAASQFAVAFDLAEEFDYPIVTCVCVAGLGGVAQARGDAATAARLFGAVDQRMNTLGAGFEPTDRADIDAYVAAARTALGNAAFDVETREGQRTAWVEICRKARNIAR